MRLNLWLGPLKEMKEIIEMSLHSHTMPMDKAWQIQCMTEIPDKTATNHRYTRQHHLMIWNSEKYSKIARIQ